MSVSGKIARLTSEGKHQGTAWMIASKHALTACHCVMCKDGTLRDNLSLLFVGLDFPVPVKILEAVPELDTALLKVIETSIDLSDRVIYLSRRPCQKGDKVRVIGYPKAELEQNPNGFNLTANVLEPQAARTFGGYNSPCRAIQLVDASVPPDTSGTSQLQGMSGSPIFLDDTADDEFAVGLFPEESMHGSNFFGLPIAVLAADLRFAIVHDVLLSSPHLDRSRGELYIGLTEDGQAWWSGPIGPDDIGRLWDSPGPIGQLNCHAPLSQLGRVGRALLRLAGHSTLQKIAAPDALQWQQRINKVSQPEEFEFTVRLPLDIWKTISSQESILSDGDLPALPQTFGLDDLAERLHSALDRFVLDRLHNAIYKCLEVGQFSLIGCPKLNPGLGTKMWDVWRQWQCTFENKENAPLLRRFLVLNMTVEGATSLDGDELLALGPGLCIDRLFQPTMLALALAASDVSVAPSPSMPGNLKGEVGTGHACGVSKIRGTELCRSVLENNWVTPIVILPYLGEAYLRLLDSASLRASRSGRQRLTSPGTPPLMVIKDYDFILALEDGASAVKAYYDDRKRELVELATQNELQPRLGLR